MRVIVKALRPFREALGSGELALERPEGETVEGLIRALAREHPAFAREALERDGRIALTLNLMLCGRPVGERDLGTPLRDGDEVLMFVPMSGG